MSGTPTSGLLDDIVRDSRLETYYEGALTIHLRNDPRAPPLTQKQQERWKKVRTLGYGGQGQVVLEKCVDDKPAVTERAVKKIRLQTDDSRRRYEEELATILKFSHDNVCNMADFCHIPLILGVFAERYCLRSTPNTLSNH